MAQPLASPNTLATTLLRWALILCVLAGFLCAVTDGKVDGKRRVMHDAPSDEPTFADKMWTYFKILLGAWCLRAVLLARCRE